MNYGIPPEEEVALREQLRDSLSTLANARRSEVWEIVNRLFGALQRAQEHRCALPASITEALNSGDGVYRP